MRAVTILIATLLAAVLLAASSAWIKNHATFVQPTGRMPAIPQRHTGTAVSSRRQSPDRQRQSSKAAQAANEMSGHDTLYHDKVAVLVWHEMSASKKGGDIINPKRFADDLDYLSQRGIRFITLDQFRHFMQGGPVPDNAALVTFDDGYESFYTDAYPILRQRGIPGVNFVITGDFSRGAIVFNRHMTPDEIMSMTSADTDIEVQPHTDRLHYETGRRTDALTAPISLAGVTESRSHYFQRIENDLRRCLAKLKSLTPHPLDTFAYPYGLRTPDVIRVLKQLGIRYAFTTDRGLANRGVSPMETPRVNAGDPRITPKRLYENIMYYSRHSAPPGVCTGSESRGCASPLIPSPGEMLLIGTVPRKPRLRAYVGVKGTAPRSGTQARLKRPA